ncbi:SCP-like extracellular [halophilic archaeon DL31]|jgi:uncharacterized protein YkwD|nr:SCP-like extracellular [halophilic archaeon DL31]
MKSATVAVCLLVLTAGCIVQTETSGPDTATASTPEKIDEKAESPAKPTTPSAATYDVEVSEIEDLVHRKMNQRRKAHGVEPLARSEKLDAIARYKSWDMAQRDYFTHDGAQGNQYGHLRKQYSADCPTIGQNLHRANHTGSRVQEELHNTEKVAKTTVNSLMNSPGHRQNILDPDYEVQGIGVFVDENGTVFLTQEFCG